MKRMEATDADMLSASLIDAGWLQAAIRAGNDLRALVTPPHPL